MPDEEFRVILADHTVRLERIETAIHGYFGQNGLMKKVDNVCQQHHKLQKSFWILVGVLAGSGILGSSIWAILK